MSTSKDTTIRSVIGSLRLKDILRTDLAVGVLGGIGAYWLAVHASKSLHNALPAAVALVGVVVGAIVAGTAVVAAFLNPVFLRKMRAIGEDPVAFLAPFIVSGVVGTTAALFAITLSALPPHTPSWLLNLIATITGFTVFYAIASMGPNLTTLIRLIRVQSDAAEVPDDIPVIQPGGQASRGA